jgi:histidinol-phosphate aminotransferase/imidazoleglycerol-phosphate dehydratase/histidinol-phosphatase
LTADGQLNVDACLAACTANTKLIFIPSPNAPMGHSLRRADILAICEARAGKSLVVVDEAYVGFSDTPLGYTPDLAAQPVLVVLRTLSKFYALAGERLGAVVASREVIDALRKVMSPYPLTQTSIRAALDAVSANGLLQAEERRRTLVNERARMVELLPSSPFVVKVYPSQANFLLVQAKSAKALMNRLRSFGILARDRSSELPEAVRLTVSSPEENDLVLKALDVAAGCKVKSERLFSIQRRTKETSIDVTVNLDAPSFVKVDTGIGFFDHMLAQLATHGGFALALDCKGDLHIDQHHTVEDCALALGQALKAALGDKRGIARFGFHAPLDEALAQVVIDLSGRPYAVFNGKFPVDTVGGLNMDMVPHFFQSLATTMAASVHITVTGENAHHMVEAVFKASGRALRGAFQREGQGIPSTKGVL